MADTTQPPSGTPNYTSPKGGLFGGLVPALAGTDRDIVNTNAILGGMRWTSDAAGKVAATNMTYAFPTSATDYTADPAYPDMKEISTFAALSAVQQQVVMVSFAQISSYANVTFSLAKSGLAADATLRFSQYAGSGSEARFPTNNGTYSASDARSAGENFEGGNAVPPVTGTFWGTDSLATIAHELGHSIGLKHGHDTDLFGGLSADRNDNEFSLMTYASYLGANTSSATEAIVGSTPTSFMMYDISALQYLYGANFSAVGTQRTYSWDAATGEEKINGKTADSTGVTATSKILSTVWDEGATTTYDLSNFTDNGQLDLRPGYYLHFSNAQIADLNNAAAAGTAQYQAKGNIYNALLFQGDARSLVVGLKAGSGADGIIGNDAANVIDGGAGDDTITGGAGNDTIDGGTGNDTAAYSIASTGATITRNGDGSIVVSAGAEGIDLLTNIETLQFSDKPIATSSINAHNPDDHFTVTNNSRGKTPSSSTGGKYTGPVAGLEFEYIYTGTDNLNVTTDASNEFVHTGGGFDAIDVSNAGGTNVLDGGTNSNFLVGGKAGAGSDTFFVDDRSPSGDIWSTVVNFHAGDAATIFGITQKGFKTSWVDNEGAAGFTGLTLHVTAAGVPNASITLAGYSTADLTNGRLSQSFGTTTDSVNYLYIHGDR